MKNIANSSVKYMVWLCCLMLSPSLWADGTAPQSVPTDTLENLFREQLSNFPQEKIYLQTDRGIYMSGETLWFRAHLVDALMLKQANASRYVYVELVNPLGNLVERVKIRPDSLGCFYGHIPLGEDLPEGNYSLRAYTWFMQNIGEEYFPHKLIYISDPVSEAISPEISYSAENNDIHAEIHFFTKPDNRSVTPTQAILFPDGDRDKEGKVLSLEGENIHYTFKKKEIPASRTFLLQTVYDGKISNRYFRIPELSKNFDVAFFPEGGHAAQSTTIKMAFKAIDADGLSTEIEGQVLDEEGQVCADFKSQHLGMGSFRMYYVPGKKYHAVCSDGTGVSQRFDLPEPSPDAISLNTLWSKDYLRVSLSKSPDTPLGTSLTLVAHLRGIVLYAQPWDNKQSYVDFEKNFFPAGIVHFLLVDEGRNILSERLVFSLQKSALVQTEVRLDRENYLAREKVDMDIQIKDINGNPMSGNFALAVVDRTDVKPDTVSNIVSTLLLTSDLKGHIESPLSYLQDSRSSSYALDLLMMTQGWRKYNIPEVLKGNITDTLPYNLELGDEVSGKVEGLFSALKEGNISLLALKDSLIGTELTKPDRNGRFVFDRLEYPSGTQYIVQALSKKGSSKVFIELDHVCHKFFSIFGNCQRFAHLTDTVTDTFVKHFAGILRCFIIAEDSTAGCMEQFVQHCQIKIIEFFKNRKIMKCKLIDTAFDRTSDLARSTECIFMIYKKKCQIIVPQISRKSIRTCNFDQTVDAFIKFFFHLACIDC